MATYEPAKKNTAYVFNMGLPSVASSNNFQASPTLAAGDFKVSIDGGSLNNLTNLPTVTPAAGKIVNFSLTSSEMNGDNIIIVCSDVSGAEWKDVIVNIPTVARQIDDLAYPATSGRSIVVDASGLVDANVVKIGPTGAGTAQTARDVGASVLLSSGSGAGQLDFTNGVVKANMVQILGTALTETAGQIAAGFKKFFDIASPTSTMNVITAVTTTTTATNLTNAATAGDFTATMKTSIGTAVAASAVASVTGNVGGNVVGSVGSVASGGITSGSFSAGAIDANAIATDAIGANELAASAVSEIQSGLATSASISALNNISTTQVKTQVVAALSTDTYAEPAQGNPGATISIVDKINFLYKAWRNKTTQTSTTYSLFNDDAVTVDHKSTTSDDGTTFSKTEVASGP